MFTVESSLSTESIKGISYCTDKEIGDVTFSARNVDVSCCKF